MNYMQSISFIDFNIPCGCGGAKKIDVINNWISDLKKGSC